MTFQVMRLQELRDVCEKFAVEYEPGANKKDLLTRLDEEGVDYDTYEKLYVPKEKSEAESVPSTVSKKDQNSTLAVGRFSQQTVVKMERKNPRYEIKGKTFTRDHPFLAMSEAEAQEIIDAVKGFRIATPREVESYYSQI